MCLQYWVGQQAPFASKYWRGKKVRFHDISYQQKSLEQGKARWPEATPQTRTNMGYPHSIRDCDLLPSRLTAIGVGRVNSDYTAVASIGKWTLPWQRTFTSSCRSETD